MQDLLLWQTLRSRRFTSAEIAPLLRELAEAPLVERMPFFGLLPMALTHPDGEVRSAAVDVLRGARGRLALQRLIAALHDPEPAVRLTAVEALRESVEGGDSARWVHVLFHADPAVRQAGLVADWPFPPPLLYKLFLLPDPICGPIVQQQLDEAVLRADALPLLFEYVQRGLLSPPLARRLAARVSWDDWLAYLDDNIPRDSDMTDLVQNALQPDWPALVASNYRPDRLDVILHLFWEVDLPPVAGQPTPSEQFFDLLLNGTLAQPAYFRPWVVFSLLCIAAQAQSWPAPAAAVCAVLEFGFLSCAWVPAAVRRAALAGVYRMGERCPRRPAEDIQPLLQGDLCRLADGGLDLWAVGGVLRLLDGSPYERLLGWLSLSSIVNAFLKDLDQGFAFLGLTDPSHGGHKARRLILREIWSRLRGDQSARVLARVARTVPGDALDFLDALDGAAACQVFAQLLLPAEPPGSRMSDNRTRRLADILAAKIVAGQVATFLRVWLAAPVPEGSALGLAILGRLARHYDPRFLNQALRGLSPELLPRFLAVATCCAGFPYDQELQLAELVAEHPDELVRAWAEQRLAPPTRPRQRAELAQLKVGLCERLRQEADPAQPNLEFCLALLASHDPIREVDEQFARFSSSAPELVNRFEVEMVADWRGEVRLPVQGHAWLHRWDPHATAFGELSGAAHSQGVADVLRFARTLTSPLLRRRFWQATARLLEIWRWHERDRFAAAWDEPLGEVLAGALPTEVGDVAAGMLLLWREEVPQSEVLERLKLRIMGVVPDLPEALREQLQPWIDARGLPPAPPEPEAVPEDLALQIDCCDDYDSLLAWIDHHNLEISARAMRRLLQLTPMTRELALLLVRSPSPYAYQPAVEHLLQHWDGGDEVTQGLLAFLQAGTGRMRELRLRVAECIERHGRGDLVLPLLLQHEPTAEPPYPELLKDLSADLVDVVITSVLMAGQGEEPEKMLLALLAKEGVDRYAREEGYGRLLSSAETPSVRQEARRKMRPSLARALKLRRVAETFAWGVRIGRELTGKLFTLVMIAGEALGYTRFRENKLYITPMPILRGEPYARQIVRALILHEYGHHLYHRGEVAEAIWKQSEEERIHRLLNLVADEHLERNLRALDRNFGDQLKLLAAYAFQHTNREFPVDSLLTTLGGRAFGVLSRTHLGVARRYGCVLVSNGWLLVEMERAGFSFARFIRALRMGLGNRHGDPKVAEALALFRGRFRRSTMADLLDIARELRRIFGDETELLNSFSQDDSLGVDETELADAGEDISGDELESAVQGALQVRRRGRSGDAAAGEPGGRGLNLDEDTDFPPITTVVPVPFDPAQHAVYAEQVARPAQQLRRYFRDLGLGLQPQRFRMRGKSLDRTRLKAVLLRGDPRMLIAREVRRYTDLFLGVVIDCSGSMAGNRNIEKAKLFGTLLAEATHGHPGIDLRLFGFTDRVIYDAGSASRCAVHGLEASDGNNDAAGLWHAAQAARASRRRAKLLVMISDGSPTECSVAALSALVGRLTRQMKISCAQVAVCPLDHICFPNYILLDEDSPEESVRRFGAVITRLVGQALR